MSPSLKREACLVLLDHHILDIAEEMREEISYLLAVVHHNPSVPRVALSRLTRGGAHQGMAEICEGLCLCATCRRQRCSVPMLYRHMLLLMLLPLRRMDYHASQSLRPQHYPALPVAVYQVLSGIGFCVMEIGRCADAPQMLKSGTLTGARLANTRQILLQCRKPKLHTLFNEHCQAGKHVHIACMSLTSAVADGDAPWGPSGAGGEGFPKPCRQLSVQRILISADRALGVQDKGVLWLELLLDQHRHRRICLQHSCKAVLQVVAQSRTEGKPKQGVAAMHS